MDGENNGKPLWTNGWFGGKHPYFWKHPSINFVEGWAFAECEQKRMQNGVVLLIFSHFQPAHIHNCHNWVGLYRWPPISRDIQRSTLLLGWFFDPPDIHSFREMIPRPKIQNWFRGRKKALGSRKQLLFCVVGNFRMSSFCPNLCPKSWWNSGRRRGYQCRRMSPCIVQFGEISYANTN